MFAVDRGLAVQGDAAQGARAVRLQDETVGLGEVEVFGTGAVMATDDDLYYVNTDVEGLKPGRLYHYPPGGPRGAAGAMRGEDRTFTAQHTNKPLCHTGQASQADDDHGEDRWPRHPLGEAAQFYFEYGPDEKYGSKTAPAWAGQQIFGRLVFAELTGLKPGTTYHHRLAATNASGTSHGADATFSDARREVNGRVSMACGCRRLACTAAAVAQSLLPHPRLQEDRRMAEDDLPERVRAGEVVFDAWWLNILGWDGVLPLLVCGPGLWWLAPSFRQGTSRKSVAVCAGAYGGSLGASRRRLGSRSRGPAATRHPWNVRPRWQPPSYSSSFSRS